LVLLTLGASTAQAAGHGGYAGPVSRLIVTQGSAWTGAVPIAIFSVILGLVLLGVARAVTVGWSTERAGLAAVPVAADEKASPRASDEQESGRKAA
jgi:hypothetical protein